jgi:peptidoglycan hydrolase-like protein with peptidoglycan-binding domain
LTLGYPIEATGVFDEATDEAVRQFQASNGLQVDGIVGENTYQALDASLEP